MNKTQITLFAIGTGLAALTLSAHGASPFVVRPLTPAVGLATGEAGPQTQTGDGKGQPVDADSKHKGREGKCGEGKCGNRK